MSDLSMNKVVSLITALGGSGGGGSGVDHAARDMISLNTETSTTASRAYVAGEYFVMNSTLYRVTLPIASGGTIIANGNCVATTIGAELTALNNEIQHGVVYGFHIDSSESDPSACVTYLCDAVGKTPAAMNYTTGVFDYGGWRNAFFMPRPCMLKYDGTVGAYLDSNDYSKNVDGTPSSVADDTYGGNAMMEWGRDGKKIWYKIVPDADDNTSASVYIADYQADSDYRAWSFINNQGVLVDHFYTPIYNGSIDSGGKLRSISGKAYTALCQSKTAAEEVAAAELNNPSTDKLWYTEVYADIILVDLLLILMGKSLNSQKIFGAGLINQANSASSMLATGTMDDKGLFWGPNGDAYGVKVFGMENWWGNQWRRYAGHVIVDYVQKYKMTRGTQDGSSASDYVYTSTAADYAGYLTGATGPSTSNYIKTMQFDANCMQVKTVDAAEADSSSYWCDYWYQNDGMRYANRGGYCYLGRSVGANIYGLNRMPGTTNWYVGAALSCKPLAASAS